MPQNSPEVASLIASFVNAIEQLIHETAASHLDVAISELRDELLGVGAHVAPARGSTVATRHTRAPQPRRTRRPKHGASTGVAVSPPIAAPTISHPAPVLVPPKQLGSIALPKPKTPTVIPANVQITRLPPGPSPKERRVLTGSSVLCRLPGCNSKHSGPRYDLFCRDHYAVLNADDRFRYRELWKAQVADA